MNTGTNRTVSLASILKTVMRKTITIIGILVLSLILGSCMPGFGSRAEAAIKVLSDSRHYFGSIITTINNLLGPGHVGTDIIVHSTNMGANGPFSADVNDAINTSATYYDESGNPVPSQAPYELFTTSATLYSGDTVIEYNLTVSYDLAHNYSYSAVLPAGSLPPAFHIAPGWSGLGGVSGPGIEWTLDCSTGTVFDCSTLSGLVASNAGLMAALRYNHPTWNWFDVKAALRQTGSNWATGYDPNNYGFGQVDYFSANALSNNGISLQPPPATADTSTGIILFHIYPFKQTRRVKEVLFQFPSALSLNSTELTLSDLQALGGTKITEYSGVTDQTFQPITATVNNAYFIWFTADNANDSVAHYSRIDTYNVLGPLSQQGYSPAQTPALSTLASFLLMLVLGGILLHSRKKRSNP